MAMPAARVGDPHECPLLYPTPHGVGTIITPPPVPGQRRVLINGKSAATETNECMCESPSPLLNLITGGSATVLIKGKPAARMLDNTAHGGRITSGSPNVLIGDYTARAATKVFQGQQRWGNCGLMSCQQIIRQATGKYWEEEEFLSNAVTEGFAKFHILLKDLGAMNPIQKRNLLNVLNVPSTAYHFSDATIVGKNFTNAELRSKVENSLSRSLRKEKGVIASTDAGKFWKNNNYNGEGHSIVITEGVFNGNKKLTHVYVDDTGTNHQGRLMTVDEIVDAMHRVYGGFSHYWVVITDNSIWHQPPPPPSRGPTPFPNSRRTP